MSAQLSACKYKKERDMLAMRKIRLTMAQALVRAMAAQKTVIETPAGDSHTLPFFGGVWAIFGHGNVAGMGEALHGVRDVLPTYRAHNEQAMAHAAIAYTKALRRRRVMACTTSIGPGALNLVTAAAVAHVNRLPLLLLPGDVFASRRPDPVLQQVEDWQDGTISANDAFRPVSRYFDRITRPEQIMPAFARAMEVLTDPAECGPVTLGLCQDVQAEAFDFPGALLRGAHLVAAPRTRRHATNWPPPSHCCGRRSAPSSSAAAARSIPRRSASSRPSRRAMAFRSARPRRASHRSPRNTR